MSSCAWEPCNVVGDRLSMPAFLDLHGRCVPSGLRQCQRLPTSKWPYSTRQRRLHCYSSCALTRSCSVARRFNFLAHFLQRKRVCSYPFALHCFMLLLTISDCCGSALSASHIPQAYWQEAACPLPWPHDHCGRGEAAIWGLNGELVCVWIF